LDFLFQSERGMIVLAPSGDELRPSSLGLYDGLEPSPYVVADEEVVDKVDDDHPFAETEEEFRQRFRRLQRMQDARREVIKELYKPKHPHLYSLSEDFFVSSFLEAAKEPSNKEKLLSILHQETSTRIFSFDMFTKDFCRELIEEIEHFEASGLPVNRPNSMNNYGVILDEIGFTPFLSELRMSFLIPFTQILYPDVGGASLDHHHGFVVQYKMKEDKGLNFHYDESEVTLNVCLGKEFEGGSLYFQGLLMEPSTHDENFEFRHVPGRAILHIGKHRHGANPIENGERFNIILWMMSSTYQLKQAQTAHKCCHHDHLPDEDGHGVHEC